MGHVSSVKTAASLPYIPSTDRLCEKAESIYQKTIAIRSLMQSVVAQPMRAGCATVSVMYGVSSLFAGDLVGGAVATTCGLTEMWNLSHSAYKGDLQELLDNIGADLGMVQTLEEAQKQSFDRVSGHLDVIQQGVHQLHEQMDQIQIIHKQGLEEISLHKEEAIRLNQKALNRYKEAEALFQEAADEIQHAQKHYASCHTLFKQMSSLHPDQLPPSTLEETLQNLINQSAKASYDCQQGKTALKTSEKKLAQALETLKDADALKVQAVACTTKAIEIGESALKAAQQEAKYTKESEQKIQEAQAEMQKIKDRHTEIMVLLDALQDDLEEAKEAAAYKFSVSELGAGLAAATVCAPGVGFLGGIAVGVSALYATRYSSDLYRGAKNIYNWAYGIEEASPLPMKAQELTRIEFQTSSSGYWGYFMAQRPSHTVGVVRLNLGSETITVPFNLNRIKEPIAKEHQLALFRLLREKVLDGSLPKERCLQILENLENMSVDRGAWDPPTMGLIKQGPTYAIVKLLKELCTS